MERKSFRLREYPAIAELAQMYVEINGMDYKDAIKKAKELIGSERVGARIDSDNNLSNRNNDSIPENLVNEN